MRTLRDKLTYANVISTLCLFMLLGGGAYAASQLPKNSVGAKQIKNGAITGKKIKKASIDSSKLTPATVTTLKGTKGDAGPAGPQGSQGTTNSGAYATVNVGELVFIGSHPGFASVERDEVGVYCLTPSLGTSTNHPIASADWWNSSGVGFFVEPLANGIVFACEEGQLEVRTSELLREENEGETEEEIEENSLVPTSTNDVSFTVFAPQE